MCFIEDHQRALFFVFIVDLKKPRGLLFIHLPAALDSPLRAGTALRIGCYVVWLLAWELGDDSGIWSSLMQVTAVNACVRLFYMLG